MRGQLLVTARAAGPRCRSCLLADAVRRRQRRSVGAGVRPATVQLHTAAAASDARVPGLRRREASRLREGSPQLGRDRRRACERRPQNGTRSRSCGRRVTRPPAAPGPHLGAYPVGPGRQPRRPPAAQGGPLGGAEPRQRLLPCESGLHGRSAGSGHAGSLWSTCPGSVRLVRGDGGRAGLGATVLAVSVVQQRLPRGSAGCGCRGPLWRRTGRSP